MSFRHRFCPVNSANLLRTPISQKTFVSVCGIIVSGIIYILKVDSTLKEVLYETFISFPQNETLTVL